MQGSASIDDAHNLALTYACTRIGEDTVPGGMKESMSRGIGMRLMSQRHRTVALDRTSVATNSSRGGGDGSSKPQGRILSLSFDCSGQVTNFSFFCLSIVALLVFQLLGTGGQFCVVLISVVGFACLSVADGR